MIGHHSFRRPLHANQRYHKRTASGWRSATVGAVASVVAIAALLFAPAQTRAESQADSIGVSFGLNFPGIPVTLGSGYAPSFTVDSGSDYQLHSVVLPFMAFSLPIIPNSIPDDFQVALYKTGSNGYPVELVENLSVSVANQSNGQLSSGGIIPTISPFISGNLVLSGSANLEAGETYSVVVNSKLGTTSIYLFGVNLLDSDIMLRREGTDWDIPTAVPTRPPSGQWALQTKGYLAVPGFNISGAASANLGRPMMGINATAVPEPTTIALSMGALALAFSALRRRRVSARAIGDASRQ